MCFRDDHIKHVHESEVNITKRVFKEIMESISYTKTKLVMFRQKNMDHK